MPGETHQLGREASVGEILDLIAVLLGEQDRAQLGEMSATDVGISEVDVWNLWASVCEEFGERTLGGGDLDLSGWDPYVSMRPWPR